MFGERMKAARNALGYSAEQVAAYLNVSPATVYRYEKGDIEKMPAKTLKALADFLCVSQGYLMGWTDDNSSFTFSEQSQYPDPLSPEEKAILEAYRKADTYIKSAVRKLLDIPDD